MMDTYGILHNGSTGTKLSSGDVFASMNVNIYIDSRDERIVSMQSIPVSVSIFFM